MERVIAIVVTYNRQFLLAQCISALKNQTRQPDKILVINNGSTDDTELWLRNHPGIDFITQKNLGGAGGFYTGIKTAFEHQYTWIWLMDDDGYPKEDALEVLLNESGKELCLLNCAVINKEDKKSFVWKTGEYNCIDDVKEKQILDTAHPFNGTLLHRKIVEKVGFPNYNLFLWGDETEYLFRITRKYKIPAYTNLASIHYHPASPYSFKSNWDYGSAWKMYYYVRNRFFIFKSKYSDHMVLVVSIYLAFLFVFVFRIIVYQKTDKLRKLRFILWPVADAFASNFKATPTSILKRISEAPGNHTFDFLSQKWKNVRLFIVQMFSSNLSKLKKAVFNIQN